MSSRNALSLFEVSKKIANALDMEFPGTIWVVGEISEIKESTQGHCYLELVEKDDNKDSPKAKARGTIWARTYRMVKPYFETATGRRLQAGFKVLVQCSVNYHPVYSLSLNIIDIDPTFTLGDLEMVRQQTINRLIAEGVMDMNKDIDLPMLPKRVAVVSSPTAAGFEDFANQLENNPYGYRYKIKLFAATMQGEKAEESIVMALDRIFNDIPNWDIVVIIRGGGSQIDLGCFDSYTLANNIAQFPLPIVTGIGHEKDVTVADMVAHTRVKTPTAVAEFLIDQFANAENWLVEANENFTDAVKLVTISHVQSLSKFGNLLLPAVMKSVSLANNKLHRLRYYGQETVNKFNAQQHLLLQKVFARATNQVALTLSKQQVKLNQNQKRIKADIINQFRNENVNISYYQKSAKALDPMEVLKRGYSLTMHNGKIIKDSNILKDGDKIETTFAKSKLISIVEKEAN